MYCANCSQHCKYSSWLQGKQRSAADKQRIPQFGNNLRHISSIDRKQIPKRIFNTC